MQGRARRQALARADVSLTRAQMLTDEFEINVYLADLHECRGRIALARGDVAAFQSELEQARHRYGEMGATLQLDRLTREYA